MSASISNTEVRARLEALPQDDPLRPALDLYLRWITYVRDSRALETTSDCMTTHPQQFVNWLCCAEHRSLLGRHQALLSEGTALMPALASGGSVLSEVWWRRLDIEHHTGGDVVD